MRVGAQLVLDKEHLEDAEFAWVDIDFITAEPGLLLLRDLRALHVLAAGASLDWVALGQAAQAARDTELLEAVSACHRGTLRTLKWTTYRLKEAAPQTLTS